MKFAVSIFTLLLSATLVWAQASPTQTANLDACVASGAYDPATDYFPEKASFSYTENIRVEYANNYKVVTVTDAYDGADAFTYVLVQCGTPAPAAQDFPAGTQFVDVPVSRFVALSTTQIPHLIMLNQLDTLIGMDSFLYVSAPEVRERIAADALAEVGFGAEINIEVLLDIEPDLVMSYGFDPQTDAHPKLIEAGIFAALNAEWRENDPLGRAEWLKYTALFFNAEQEAAADFDEIVAAYEDVRASLQDIPQDERVSVLWNSPFQESWVIPGVETFSGKLIEDAGGIVALAEEAPTPDGLAFLALETVYAEALDADVWVVNQYNTPTLSAFIAQDNRYTDFSAVQSGNVWNNDKDSNENGGNNFYELGVTRPDLVLQDLAAAFYPERYPTHEFSFLRQLAD